MVPARPGNAPGAGDGQGGEILGQTLSSFITYTTHFAAEERLMLTHHYPDLVSHKTQHDDLCDQLSHLQSEFEAGQPAITLDLLKFLKAWLVHHISATDQKMGAYLGGQGALKPAALGR